METRNHFKNVATPKNQVGKLKSKKVGKFTKIVLIVMFFAISGLSNIANAQSVQAYSDATIDGRGFSYNVQLSITPIENNEVTHAGGWIVKLISVNPDSKGYYHKGKTNRYFSCSELGSICNPTKFDMILVKVKYECENNAEKLIVFYGIDREETIVVRQKPHTKCSIELESVKVRNNTDEPIYRKRINEIEYPQTNTNPSQKQTANSTNSNSSQGGNNTQHGNSNSESVNSNSTQNSNNQNGEITNMSEPLGLENRTESIQVYQQNGKYYAKNSNGSITLTTKEYFNHVHATTASNKQIETNNAKRNNDPLYHYNNPNAASSEFQKNYETGQQIADVVTPLATGLVELWNNRVDAINKEISAARNEDERRKIQFNEKKKNIDQILKSWNGFNDYVIKRIPNLMEQPSPSWETLLGSAQYVNIFGKDLDYIVQNYKPKGGYKRTEIKEQIEKGNVRMWGKYNNSLYDFYAAYPFAEYPFDYFIDNSMLSKKTSRHHSNFIFDEKNIVIGIDVHIYTCVSAGNMVAVTIEKYIEDLKNKMGNNYVMLNANTFLIKDKLIIVNYDDILMYDLNFLHDKLRLKWPTDYLNVEYLAKRNIGISFPIDSDTSAIHNKRLQPEIARWGWMEGHSYFSFVTSEKGIIIGKIVKGSLADKSGLQEGDIVTEIRGFPVKIPIMFQLIVKGYSSEGSIDLSFLREGKEYKTAFIFEN